MRLSNAVSGPKMNLDITSAERKVARHVKKNLVDSLQKLDDAVKVVTNLRDAVARERPSREKLKTKYRGKLLRYRRKIRKLFNIFLIEIKNNLERLSKISDPEMIHLREIIIAEVGELSDGVEAIMDLLEEVERERFTKTLEQLSQQIEKRQKSIIDVIENQLVSHIDNDILGKMRLSNIRFNIKKRSRLIRQFLK